MDAATLGKTIQSRKKSQGMTQEQLRHSAAVSPQAVSKWETGESMPDIGAIPSLCRALGVSANVLLGIEHPWGYRT